MMAEFSRLLLMGILNSLVQRRSFSTLRYVVALFFLWISADASALAPATDPNGPGLKPILDYISSAWDTLTRSMTDCQSIVDPKLKAAPVLYLPAGFPEPPAVQKLAA